MNTKFPLLFWGLLCLLFISTDLFSQCPTNSGFELGNLTSWESSTDSIYMTPASRVYTKPGINTNVVGYGITDPILGLIYRADNKVGNYLSRVGNSSVRGVSDTIYRKYIIDSLSDEINIYSLGVSQGAHAYWGLNPIQAPGFGYQVFINGREMNCIGGKFFCGNVDIPPVWQFGKFKDSSGLRKSTNWGIETLNLSCFNGDTLEIRLFTRDCILMGHFAYAYFDIVCSNAQPPSQLIVKDIIKDTSLLLFDCENGKKIKISPVVENCPYFMDSISWTPKNYIKGAKNSDTAFVDVIDSGWVYIEAQFTNYCTTIKFKDSIFIKKVPFNPRLKIPNLDRNFCDCNIDTLDFSKVKIKKISNTFSKIDTLVNGNLLISPCDNYYENSYWKNISSNSISSGGSIGATSWSSGKNSGGIGYDTLIKSGRIKYVTTTATGKSFYVGINSRNVNNNNDLTHSIFFNGTFLSVYYGTNLVSNLGNYTGRVVVEFDIDASGRVKIYINNSLVYTYSNNRLAPGPTFPDYSGWSNTNPHIDSVFVYGKTMNKKRFPDLKNLTPLKYYLEYDAGCDSIIKDTITYIPWISINKIVDLDQCGLNPIPINLNSIYKIDSTKYEVLNSKSKIIIKGQGFVFLPSDTDYFKKPVEILITSYKGKCKSIDTSNLWINEIPVANAGIDTTIALDSFRIGGNPTGFCLSCDTLIYKWSQGKSLKDSTEKNPLVYSGKIKALKYFVTVVDPKTGCFSVDSVNLLAPLPFDNLDISVNCYSNNLISINWSIVEADDIFFYVIDFSKDNGITWENASKIRSGKTPNGLINSYTIEIPNHLDSKVIYKWYTENSIGEKSRINFLHDFDCNSETRYIIFPNPFDNTIEIKMESNGKLEASYKIQILDNQGKIIKEKYVESNEVKSESIIYLDNLDSLSSGIYILNIISKDRILYRKVIIK